MALAVRCPSCRAQLGVKEDAVGKQVRCPHCAAEFPVEIVLFVASTPEDAIELDESQNTPDDVDASAYLEDRESHESFGRFHLEQLLGEGTYGKVYRAYDPVLDRHVAIKIPKLSGEDARRQERFLREAKAAARLRHANIVGVHESGRIGNDFYIASEFIDGAPLTELISQEGLSYQEVARICAELAEGLAYAHEHGVVHRDIKPGNILIGSDGTPQIADFGLAKRLDEDATMTTEGGFLGTPAYMPPEQARGELDKIGPASDQYSLGVVMFELLTGRRPFDGPPHQMIALVAGDTPVPALRPIRSSVPRDLEAICLRCLEKSPLKRYKDVRAVAEDLRRWIDGRPVRARRTSELEYLLRWCKRNPVLSLSLVVTTAVLLAATGGLFTKVIVDRQYAQNQQELRTSIEQIENQRNVMEREIRLARKQLYLSDLNRADSTYKEFKIGRTREILDGQVPEKTGGEDLREWEWYYLNRQSHTERSSLNYDAMKIAFTPDGKWIVGGDIAGNITIAKGDGSQSVHNYTGDGERTYSIQVSRKGGVVVKLGQRAHVRLWTIADDGSLAPIAAPEIFSIAAPAINDDGTQIAVLKNSDGGVVEVWSVTDGKLIRTITSPNPRPLFLSFVPGQNQLICGLEPRKLAVYDLGTGDKLRVLDVEGMSHGLLRFDDSGRTVFLDTERSTIQIRDFESWNVKGEISGHSGSLRGWAVSPDGQHVATASSDSVVRWWRVVEPSKANICLGHETSVRDVAFRPHEVQLYSVGSERLLKGWDSVSDSNPSVLKPGMPASSVSFSSDGKLLAVGGEKGFVVLNPDSSEEIWKAIDTGPSIHDTGPRSWNRGLPHSIAFNPSSTLTAIGEADGHVMIRDAANGKEVVRLEAHTGSTNAVVFSPMQKILATGGQDGKISLWDTESWKRIQTMEVHSDAILSLRFSPDAKILVSCSDRLDKSLRFWNMPAGLELFPAIGDHGTILDLEFTPDSQSLFFGGRDETLFLWNMSKQSLERSQRGFGENVTVIKVSPNGKRVAFSVLDTIYICDTESGNQVTALQLPGSFMNCIDFHPDGLRLAAATNRDQVLIWDARPLTPDLRNQLVKSLEKSQKP